MIRYSECLLFVLTLVAVSAATVQGDTIREDFEGYSPTSSWLPTYPATDWGYGANSPLEITASGGYGATQGLAMTSVYWPQQAYWFQAPDWSVTPKFTFAYDFMLGGGSVAIYSTNGLVTNGGQMPAAIGTGAKANGGGDFYLVTNGDTVTYLPGAENSARDVWYTAEMAYDYTTQQVRGRFGPVGGTMNDWTDWLGMYDSYKNGALGYTLFQQGHGGGTSFDNIRITPIPEPGTMVMSVCYVGGLLAYAWRKRK